LVRYTETQVRHAIRLDHGSTDDDEDEHPLMRTLVNNDGSDPLGELLVREAAQGIAGQLPFIRRDSSMATCHFINQIGHIPLS